MLNGRTYFPNITKRRMATLLCQLRRYSAIFAKGENVEDFCLLCGKSSPRKNSLPQEIIQSL